MEHLQWPLIVTFGAYQFIGTTVRRYHQIVVSPDPMIRPMGITPGFKLVVKALRFVSIALTVAIFVRAGMVGGWSAAVVLFLLALVGSLVIAFLFVFLAVRVLGVGSQMSVVYNLLAASGLLLIPVLGGISIWLIGS